MIGLEFICRAYEMEYKEVANKLNIKPQTINSWLRGKREIPKERLKQLSQLFGIEEERYFQKVLTRAEQLEINLIYFRNNYVIYETETTQIDEEGKEHTVTETYSEARGIIHFLTRKHRQALLLEQVEKLTLNYSGYGQEYEIKTLENVVKLLEGNGQKTKIMDAVLYYLTDLKNKECETQGGIPDQGFYNKFEELLKEYKLL